MNEICKSNQTKMSTEKKSTNWALAEKHFVSASNQVLRWAWAKPINIVGQLELEIA